MRYFVFILILAQSVLGFTQSGLDHYRELAKQYNRLFNEEKYDSSIYTANRILEECSTIGPVTRSWAYSNLGSCNFRLGLYSKSFEAYEKALVIFPDGPTPFYSNRVVIYMNLAILFNEIGDYHRAIEYNQEAMRALIPEDTARYLSKIDNIYLNMGMVFFELGDYQQALEVLEKAAILKKEEEYLGSVFLYFARIYENQGKNELAYQYYEQAVASWKRFRGDDYYELAGVYWCYGSFLVNQQKDSLALQTLEEANRIYILSRSKDFIYRGNVLFEIADYYKRKGEYAIAFTYLDSALHIFSPSLGASLPDHEIDLSVSISKIDVLKALQFRTSLLQELANSGKDTITSTVPALSNRGIYIYPDQDSILLKALDSQDNTLAVLGEIHAGFPSQSSQLTMLGMYKHLYMTGIDIAHELFDNTSDPYYKRKMYSYASKNKAMELEFEKKQKEYLFLEMGKDSAHEAILALNRDIGLMEYSLQSLRGSDSGDSIKIKELEQGVFELKEQYREKILALREGTALNANNNEHYSLDYLQKHLKRKEVILEYSLSKAGEQKRSLHTFLISKDEVLVHEQVFGREAEAHCQRVISMLEDPDFSSVDQEQTRALINSLSSLYTILIAPFEDKLKGRDLVIIPDEELISLPMEALIRNTGSEGLQSEQSFIPEAFLLHRHRVSYLHSSNEYKKGRTPLIGSRQLTAFSPGRRSSQGGLIELNSAWEEAELLSQMFKGSHQEAAGKEVIRSSIEQDDVIHFALHAYPGSKTAMPYLALTNTLDSTSENRLFDYEVNYLNSEASLVVLSACETAVGEQYSGEGVMNISRSFSLAGADAVVHSLWSLDDVSSKQVMVDFYRQLKRGANKSAALQKAKMNYLEEHSPGFYHPYYWAGYQLYGNPSAIRISPWIITGILLLMLGAGILGYGKRKKR